MSPLARNALVAVLAVGAWLALDAASAHLGHGAPARVLNLAVLVACSAGYWWANRRLVRRFRSPELAVAVVGGLAAVLTAVTLVLGATAAPALREWLTRS